MSAGRGWPAVADEALVEALIPAVQNAIAGGSRTHAGQPDDEIGLSAPDVANVLLMVLATVLETSPGCSTPMGMRLTA